MPARSVGSGSCSPRFRPRTQAGPGRGPAGRSDLPAAPSANGGNGPKGAGGLYAASGTVTMTNNTVSMNSAQGGPKGLGEGGGLYPAAAATLFLDAFTLDHTGSNQASTSDPDLQGGSTPFSETVPGGSPDGLLMVSQTRGRFSCQAERSTAPSGAAGGPARGVRYRPGPRPDISRWKGVTWYPLHPS